MDFHGLFNGTGQAAKVKCPKKRMDCTVNVKSQETLNIMTEWSTFILCNREVPGSNLGPQTGYPGYFSFSLQLLGWYHKIWRLFCPIFIPINSPNNSPHPKLHNLWSWKSSIQQTKKQITSHIIMYLVSYTWATLSGGGQRYKLSICDYDHILITSRVLIRLNR